jgi:hypothetical protein
VLAFLAVAGVFAVLELRPDIVSFWKGRLAEMSLRIPAGSPEASPLPLTPSPAASPALGAAAAPEGTPADAALTSGIGALAVTPEPLAASVGSPAPSATPAATPSPTPTPEPPATPSPSPAHPSPAPTPRSERKAAAVPVPTPAEKAQLRIELEHGLKSGTLRLWIDERLAATEKLTARAPLRIGPLRLAAGSHSVRMEVRWGKSVRTARTTASFSAGKARRLDAELSRGELTLRWR